jgi:hypothetical protein
MANHSFQVAERIFADSGKALLVYVKADTEAGLPTTGLTEGDFAYTLDNNTAWVWTGSAWIALAGGGGGGGATWQDVAAFRQAAADAHDDEFRDDSVAAAWTATDPTTTATWTESGDVISGTIAADPAARIHALTKTLTGVAAGDSIECAMRIMHYDEDFPMAGLIFTDGTTVGAGAQVEGCVYWDQGGTVGGSWNFQIFRTTGFNTLASNAFTPNIRIAGPYIHLRLVWVSANTFRLDASPDGVTWITVVGNQSMTLTPTRGGMFLSTYGATSSMVATFEHFRFNP